jgi:hypothetical protein
MPERDALEVFRRAHQSHRFEDILSHAKNGDLLTQLSLVPDTNRRYDFPYRLAMLQYC